jgi:hypothetical protein
MNITLSLSEVVNFVIFMRTLNKQPFSAHDVTQAVRSAVQQGIVLSDAAVVRHYGSGGVRELVKAYVEKFPDAFDKSFAAGGWFVYTYRGDDKAPVSAAVAVPMPQSATTLEMAVKRHLVAKGTGKQVTIKGIQSALKSFSVKCSEIHDALVSLSKAGHKIVIWNDPDGNISKTTVKIID